VTGLVDEFDPCVVAGPVDAPDASAPFALTQVSDKLPVGETLTPGHKPLGQMGQQMGEHLGHGMEQGLGEGMGHGMMEQGMGHGMAEAMTSMATIAASGPGRQGPASVARSAATPCATPGRRQRPPGCLAAGRDRAAEPDLGPGRARPLADTGSRHQGPTTDSASRPSRVGGTESAPHTRFTNRAPAYRSCAGARFAVPAQATEPAPNRARCRPE